ncbi:ATP-binding protein [Streptomyces sp. NPDC087218]|uniref:ATP-binding protein n=1 Tax=Streptomyces sp. NPDC087218 TaxID=3365769 RepID=UPI0037FBB195
MTAAEQNPAPEPLLREDRLDFAPTADRVSFSRRRTARLVREWGYPGLAGDAALLVSELATNALLHGVVRVRLALTAATLRVAVSDPWGERLPVLREATSEECYGRGLLIVASIADRWGVESRTVSKTVFAELALRRGPDAPVGPRELRAGPPHARTAGTVTPK